LEVSHLSFIKDIGDKNKEGLVRKKSIKIPCFFKYNLSLGWNSKWLIIKDSWIAYLNLKTGAIRNVLLVDQGFEVTANVKSTGEKYGLLVKNLSKSILFKCSNEKHANEWQQSIEKMKTTTGAEFTKHQRFQSFAPQRHSSDVKWFVDGADYMETVANAISTAKEEIFITGFFISPEIHLKRPIVEGEIWRLDKLLQRKAEEGIKIYILIYKEIEMTLSINSAYAKRVLALTHSNIKVIRHPDHINEPNQLMSIMWAHHEKLVIVDQSIAFFGGIDLCFGRWDTCSHK
jgi:phospholipase D1/2